MNHKHEKSSEKVKGEGDRSTFAERMNRILDVPSDLLLGGCYLEMRGRGELKLQGCRRIAVYTEEQIVLCLRRGAVRVRGMHMSCTSYHGGCAVIEGRIEGVDFTDEGAFPCV